MPEVNYEEGVFRGCSKRTWLLEVKSLSTFLSNLWKAWGNLLWRLTLLFNVPVISKRSHFNEVSSWGSFTFCFWCDISVWELGNFETNKNPLFLNLSSTGRWLSAVDQLFLWWEVAVILKIHVEICITGPLEQKSREKDMASVLSLITALTEGTLNLSLYLCIVSGWDQALINLSCHSTEIRKKNQYE